MPWDKAITRKRKRKRKQISSKTNLPVTHPVLTYIYTEKERERDRENVYGFVTSDFQRDRLVENQRTSLQFPKKELALIITSEPFRYIYSSLDYKNTCFASLQGPSRNQENGNAGWRHTALINIRQKFSKLIARRGSLRDSPTFPHWGNHKNNAVILGNVFRLTVWTSSELHYYVHYVAASSKATVSRVDYNIIQFT